MIKTKKLVYCPFCECEHELEYIEEKDTLEVKGEDVEYESHYYYCPKHPEEPDGFVNGKMMDENLNRARNAYRSKHNLLTSGQIVATRKQYNLSQVELAKLLGWGGATISRYETKQIQDEAHDSILKTIIENPVEADKYLEKNKEQFDEKRYEEIKSKIASAIKRSDFLQRELLKSEYINYRVPSEYNGFQILNIDVVEQVITYVASKTENMYKTMLMKYLWYIDMNYYNLYGKSLTGLVYLHQDYGALAMGHIIDLKNVVVETEYKSDGGEIYHILSNPELKIKLDKDTMTLIDSVIAKLKKMNRTQLVNYMHKEKAYLSTDPNEPISYEYAKELNDF